MRAECERHRRLILLLRTPLLKCPVELPISMYVSEYPSSERTGARRFDVSMNLETYRHPNWLTNTYLLRSEGAAILIDAGVELSAFSGIDPASVRAIFLTHSHGDHIDGLRAIRAIVDVPVYSHPLEQPQVPGAIHLKDQEIIEVDGFTIHALHTPGHTRGHLSFFVENVGVFTGDLLFRESVGGTVHGGPSGIEDLRSSIRGQILTLPPETKVFPGHQEPSTVGHELERNRIIRAWLGKDPLLSKRCALGGRQGEILAECRDYDGDTKVWVRFSDGAEVVMAGSDLDRAASGVSS